MHTALVIDFWSAQGARRKHIQNGSVTDEQRSAGRKAKQPFGREHLGAPGGVVRSLQVDEGHAPRSRLAIHPKLLSRGVYLFFNGLLGGFAPHKPAMGTGGL